MARQPKKGKRRPHPLAHGTEHEEETWLVSYADMMTLLFGFFVILYSFSTLDEKKFAAISKEMAEALGKDKKESAEESQLLTAEQERLKFLTLLVSMMNMGSVDDVMSKVQKKKDQEAVADAAKAALGEDLAPKREKILEVVLPEGELFDGAGGVAVSARGQKSLAALAEKAKRLDGLVEVHVESHTDGDRNRLYRSAWALSSARAGAVAESLAGLGLDRKKLLTAGYGDSRPLFPEAAPGGAPLVGNRAKNRRVHVILKRSVDAKP